MRRQGKLTDEQIRAAHVVYEQTGLSLRALAAQLWERYEYASMASCRQSLLEGFIRLGLPRRDRIEATIAAATVHGKARGKGYRAWLREQRGEARPRCAGKVKREGGRRCELSAMHGSRFCLSHDPKRRAEVLARIASLSPARLHPQPTTGGSNDGPDSRREGNPSRSPAPARAGRAPRTSDGALAEAA